MCKYCNGEMCRIEDEYEEFEADIVHITPFPAIDLNTGKIVADAADPYYALFIYYYGDTGEKGSFPINFCPMCGERLK